MRIMTITMALACLLSGGAVQADEIQVALDKAIASTSGALATVRYVVRDDEQREDTMEGMAVCIDSDKSIFVSFAVSPRIPLIYISDFRLFLSGIDKEFKAELLGVDNETGLSFFRCLDSQKFAQVTFTPAGDVKLGMNLGENIVGVGLLNRPASYSLFVGVARVAGLMRLPESTVMMTNGFLAGSPAVVFDMQGKALGLVQPGRAQSGQFFMPTEEFVHLLADMPAGGKTRRAPWLGTLELDGLSRQEEMVMNLGQRTGVRIRSLIAGQPAEKAGLRENDVITGLDGQPVERFPAPEISARNLMRQIAHRKVGQDVQLSVMRDGKEMNLPVTLAASPAPVTEAPRTYNRPLGLAVRELVLLERYALRLKDDQSGVVVDFVRPQGLASKELQGGEVILKIDGKPTPDVQTLAQVLQAALADPKTPEVTMDIQRGAEAKTIHIQKPQAGR